MVSDSVSESWHGVRLTAKQQGIYMNVVQTLCEQNAEMLVLNVAVVQKAPGFKGLMKLINQ
jgi:hypothetical protein